MDVFADYSQQLVATGCMSTQDQWDSATSLLNASSSGVTTPEYASWSVVGPLDSIRPLESTQLAAGEHNSLLQEEKVRRILYSGFAADPSMQAHGGSLLLQLLPSELHEQIAFVLQEDKSAIRTSCRYLRDMVDRMATTLEVRPMHQTQSNEDIEQLPVGLLASCPNLSRIDLSGGCDDCIEEPRYGPRGGRPTRCKRHMEPIMRDLVGPTSHMVHKEPGSENVCHKRCCDHPEGCSRKPKFGMPGGWPASCPAHREPGMVNVRYKRCDHSIECRRKPRYGPPGIGPSSCVVHKEPGMVSFIHRHHVQKGLAQRGCVPVSDLTPLNALPRLREIVCINTRVRDLTPLAAMTTLRSLNCSYSQVMGLGPLAALTALQNLDCSGTRVTDLSPVAVLTALQSLDCSDTQVNNLAPLAALTTLQSLNCSRTATTVLSPLSSVTSLRRLDCSNTRVTDVAPLAALARLRRLDCSRTQVTDLSPLAASRTIFLRVIIDD